VSKEVIYCYNRLSSFVEKDIEILSNEFSLNIHYFNVSSKYALVFSFLKQFVFLAKSIIKSHILIVQFAGFHSFLPVLLAKILGKKCILILGGTDCVSFPSIQYGCLYNKKLRPFTAYSIRHAHLLLPVHDSLVHCEYTYQTDDFPSQGYKAHLKNIHTPFKVIYNGYDSTKWRPSIKQTNTFVTVGADFSTRFGLRLKGIDLILEVAPYFPNCSFYIIGEKRNVFEIPENVKLIEFIPNEKLGDFIGSMEFYLQLSINEGFPNALSEAMLCGCVPIVSNVGAMPMIIENAGYILKQKSIIELILLIKQALVSEDKAYRSKQAREIITRKYNYEKRKHELLNVINQI
jgi:glycosyltransferase involved in cell wall biosynthesis